MSNEYGMSQATGNGSVVQQRRGRGTVPTCSSCDGFVYCCWENAINEIRPMISSYASCWVDSINLIHHIMNGNNRCRSRVTHSTDAGQNRRLDGWWQWYRAVGGTSIIEHSEAGPCSRGSRPLLSTWSLETLLL